MLMRLSREVVKHDVIDMMSSLYMMTSCLIRSATKLRLDIRRRRQMTAPTDSPSDVDES
ncbi:hypothetical protein HanPI659440_Chr13g0501141 [Helianthus annuus]|nr:hypothetical protein HanPI659440_Chr13g0501141 [Helianthus annuus]